MQLVLHESHQIWVHPLAFGIPPCDRIVIKHYGEKDVGHKEDGSEDIEQVHKGLEKLSSEGEKAGHRLTSQSRGVTVRGI